MCMNTTEQRILTNITQTNSTNHSTVSLIVKSYLTVKLNVIITKSSTSNKGTTSLKEKGKIHNCSTVVKKYRSPV